jgi:hypothetical protein
MPNGSRTCRMGRAGEAARASGWQGWAGGPMAVPVLLLARTVRLESVATGVPPTVRDAVSHGS